MSMPIDATGLATARGLGGEFKAASGDGTAVRAYASNAMGGVEHFPRVLHSERGPSLTGDTG